MSLKKFLIMFIVVFAYILNLFIQNYNLGKTVYVSTDEGVYLYSAKLITQGFIPYKEFFLAQPAFLIYLAGLILKIVNFDINLFRFFYTLWVFTPIFPIFFIVFNTTKNLLAAIISIILFSTFSELVQWDMHSFALRQFSLPFLAFSMLFTYIKPKLILSGLFLGLFSISLLSNLLISACFIIALFAGELIINRNTFSKILKEKFPLIISWIIVSILGYLLSYLLGGFGNIIGYQLNRPFEPYLDRIMRIGQSVYTNSWPLLLYGLLGSLVVNKDLKLFGLFNILSFLVVIFSGYSFYPHYLSILAVGLAISGGILINSLGRKITFKIAFFCSLIVISIFISSYSHLKTYLIDTKTPNFFKTIDYLKHAPEPLFSFEPIYALYADKNLTFHYNVADMRYFPVLGKSLDESSYSKMLQNSRTVLIEPFASSQLSNISLLYIQENFQKIYDNNASQIFIRNLETKN